MRIELNGEPVFHQIIPLEGFKILSERRLEAYGCPNDPVTCRMRGNHEAQCHDIMTEIKSGIDRCCNICQLTIIK